MSACVATNMLHTSGAPKICPNSLLTALPIYIPKVFHSNNVSMTFNQATDSTSFDYGMLLCVTE